MTAHKIDYFLNSSGRLRALARQARQIAELQQAFLNIVPPPLTRASRVKQLRSGTLVLLAGNAAIAAKLKQLAPRLLTAYGKLGVEVTSIRVEVQVKEASPSPARHSQKNRLSIESIENIERLAATMEDTPLKRALTNMAARQRREQS